MALSIISGDNPRTVPLGLSARPPCSGLRRALLSLESLGVNRHSRYTTKISQFRQFRYAATNQHCLRTGQNLDLSNSFLAQPKPSNLPPFPLLLSHLTLKLSRTHP